MAIGFWEQSKDGFVASRKPLSRPPFPARVRSANYSRHPGPESVHGIRDFGSRKKICHVPFRPIGGHGHDFVEVYPDEGDIDFVQARAGYRGIGYP